MPLETDFQSLDRVQVSVGLTDSADGVDHATQRAATQVIPGFPKRRRWAPLILPYVIPVDIGQEKCLFFAPIALRINHFTRLLNQPTYCVDEEPVEVAECKSLSSRRFWWPCHLCAVSQPRSVRIADNV